MINYLCYNLKNNNLYKKKKPQSSTYYRILRTTCAVVGLFASSQSYAAPPACSTGAQRIDSAPRLLAANADTTLNSNTTINSSAITTGDCVVVAISGYTKLNLLQGATLGNILLNSGGINIAGRVFGYFAAGEFSTTSDGITATRGVYGTAEVLPGGILGTALIGNGASLIVSTAGTAGVPNAIIGRIVSSGDVLLNNATVDTQYDIQVGTPLLTEGAIVLKGGRATITSSKIMNTQNPNRFAVLLTDKNGPLSVAAVNLGGSEITNTSFGIGAEIFLNSRMTLNLIDTNVSGSQTEIAMDLRNDVTTPPFGTLTASVKNGTLTGLVGMQIIAAKSGITLTTDGAKIVGVAGTATTAVARPGVGLLASGPISATFNNRTEITGATNGVYIQGSTFTEAAGAVLTFNGGSSATGTAGAAMVVDGVLSQTFQV